MTFEEFQREVGDGTHILVDGREHVVLLSQPDVVMARPEGSSVSWVGSRGTVELLNLHPFNWADHEVEVC